MYRIIRKYRFKYLNVIYTDNVNSTLFHTTKNPILPSQGQEDNQSKSDYLQCLRPATVNISDVPTLAGEPRSLSQLNHGIKPEVVEKWNQVPKYDIYKEWSKLSVFY